MIFPRRREKKKKREKKRRRKKEKGEEKEKKEDIPEKAKAVDRGVLSAEFDKRIFESDLSRDVKKALFHRQEQLAKQNLVRGRCL